MSEMGQRRNSHCEQMFSAILPTADIRQGMPKAVPLNAANSRMAHRHDGGGPEPGRESQSRDSAAFRPPLTEALDAQTPDK
jgi:hypothetical protein